MTPCELMNTFNELNKTLNQFRRHPDWGVALRRAIERLSHLSITLEDGRRGWKEEHLQTLVKAADEEFIESLIRAGH